MSVLKVFQITQKFTDIFNIRLCPIMNPEQLVAKFPQPRCYNWIAIAFIMLLCHIWVQPRPISALAQDGNGGHINQGGTDLSWYWKWHIYLTQTVFNGTRSETKNSIACVFWENAFRIKGVREAKASRKGTKHDVISPGITWVWSHRKLKENSPIELLMKYSVFTT